jgi:adenylate cyclase
MTVRRFNRLRRRALILLLLCGLWGVAGALLAWPLRLAPLELAGLSLQDAVVRHGSKTATPEDFVLLAVDEASLDLSQLEPEEIAASPALTMMAEGFPWSRAVYAEVIGKLLGAGAKAVVLDVHFPRPGEDDGVLRRALEEHRRQVVIASLFDESAAGGQVTSQYQPPVGTVLPRGVAPGAVVGFANFWPDADKVVREAHYRVSEADVLGLGGWTGPQGRGRTGGHMGQKLESLGLVGLRKAGERPAVPDAGLFRFCEPGSFRVVPLWWIFVPDLWAANLEDGAVFRDKVVMLGPLAARFRDFFRTPVGTLPGPEIHLHAMAAAREGAFYRRAEPWMVALTCLGAALAAWAASLLVRRPLAALAVLALLLAGGGAAALAVYNTFGFLPGILLPGLSLAAAGLTAFGYDFSLERREKTRVRRSLERYVSRDVVRELLDSGNDLLTQLGGSRKDVAVLFADLRGFTALAEQAEPAQLVADLNEYLAGMVEIVFRHRGTLDKFIGDAVMAVWGTVESGGRREDAVRTVRAALDMLAAVARLRAQWAVRGAPALRLGIGIHHGPAIFGNIGSELKMEPTVIGDTVNLASRLESLTKRYGVELLVSEAVAGIAGEVFAFRTVDTVRVAGRTAPVTIFTVVDGAERPAWIERHEEGWEYYRARKFEDAVRSFEACAAMGLDDACLTQMVGRCRDLAANPPGADWEAVVRMDGK